MTRKRKQPDPLSMIRVPPVDWRETADAMTEQERDEMRRQLESVARRAAEFAAYLDQRAGAGCGDQGHKSAVKAANKIGRIVWMKAFGYNAYVKATI